MSKEKSQSSHVIFLGESQFPYGFAAIQRMTLIGRALLTEGFDVTVVSRKGSWFDDGTINFPSKGKHEGISYIYTTGTIFKPRGFFKRNLNKIAGVYGEFKYLKNIKKTEKISLAIVSNRKVLHVLRYLFYARFFNFPIAINLVEMASAMDIRNNGRYKLNDYILDKWLLKYFDGALPISNKLQDHFKNLAPHKPNMKLPIICDFDKFDINKKAQPPYFLYCGSYGYKEVIDFVFESYKLVERADEVKLYMIINGDNKKEIEELEKSTNKQFSNNPVKLFNNIPYSELVALYKNAIALLIPLRDTIQDTARFPHKIGEYLAAGNPVITTDVGEIKNYFIDEENALVAVKYDPKLFAKKMTYVLDHKEKAIGIGLKGKKLGLENFDFKMQAKVLKKFIDRVSKKTS